MEEAIWKQVSSRLNAIARSPTATAIRETRFWEQRRPRHILTGLAVCGQCGHPLRPLARTIFAALGPTVAVSATTAAASAARSDDLVLEALQRNLMHPDLVAEFIRAYHTEVNEGCANEERERASVGRRLEQVKPQLDGLITAISQGFRANGLQDRISALESERTQLAEVALAPDGENTNTKTSLSDRERRSVKVVAGARNLGELTLTCPI